MVVVVVVVVMMASRNRQSIALFIYISGQRYGMVYTGTKMA